MAQNPGSLLSGDPAPRAAAPAPAAPSSSTPFAAIDAAIAAVIDDNNSADIIGTASALSTAAMNSVENMMKKLRARGKKVAPSSRPLTVDRPFARALETPTVSTARSMPAESDTGFEMSPNLSGLDKSPKEPALKTARELTAVPSETNIHTALARSPLKKSSRREEPSLRTGLGVTPPRGRSPAPQISQFEGLKTGRGVTPPASPLPAASRRQSISNVFVPSTRTGRGVTPPLSPVPSLRTGRDAAKSPAIPMPAPPASRRQSISNVHVPSTRTGLEVSPRPSEITPRSSGYPTAVEPASPMSPASRRQSISNIRVPSTRTGREVTPPPSPYHAGRGQSPQLKTAISPLYPTAQAMSPEPRTGFEASPVSSVTGIDMSPNKDAGLATGRELTPKPSQVKTALGVSPQPRREEPAVKTGREDSPPPPSKPRSRRSSRARDPSAARTGREASPRPGVSPGRNLVTQPSEALVSRREHPSDKYVPTQSDASLARNAAPPPSISPLPSREPCLKAQAKDSVRTGRDVSSRATGRAPRDESSRTGQEASSRDLPREPALKTARELTAVPSETNIHTALARSPVPSAREVRKSHREPSHRQSISNVFVPSARTGREVTPPVSPAHSLRTGRSVTPSKQQQKPESLRTGLGVTPPRGRSPAPQKSHREGLKTGRGVTPPTSPLPASRRQSISNVHVPSTRTGLEVSPRPSEITPRSSGYPTAVEPASPMSPASRRQSISNIRVPSTRTGREVTPRQSEQRLTPAEQWAAVQPGPGPQIRPAKSPALSTAREASQRPQSQQSRAVEPDQLWGALVKAAEQQKMPAEAFSPATGRSPSQRSSGYPTAIEPATPPSPASRRQSISNIRVPSTRTGQELTPRSSGYPTAREPSSTSLNLGDQVYPPLNPHAYAAVSPGGSEYSSGYPTAEEAASPLSPASRRQSISNIHVPSTRTGLEVSPRSSGYSTAVEPASPMSPASRRQSISNIRVPSTRTGREVTPRQSYDGGYPGYADQGAALQTGREKSPLGSYGAADGNPQLVATAVLPQLQHQVAAGQEDAPPGVLLFVHSFYVFSMTLNAWANHFANNNPPAQ